MPLPVIGGVVTVIKDQKFITADTHIMHLKGYRKLIQEKGVKQRIVTYLTWTI